MSFFSRLFGTHSDVPTPIQSEQEQKTLPEIKKEDSVDNSESTKDTVIIHYGTQMPIDSIYAYIERDYEEQGYNDALCNADASYKESKKVIIKNGLKRLFEQVGLRYKSDLRDIQVSITTYEQQGMVDTAASLKARSETYLEHLTKIVEMETALDKEEKQMLSMIDSYERGFLRGLAAKANSILRSDNRG